MYSFVYVHKSYTSDLIVFFHEITKKMDEGRVVNVVNMDFKKSI